jgi:hypothetical protein
MGFYLYKGLKKPLIFFGLKGKYIFYAVGVIGSGVIAALILSKFGLLGISAKKRLGSFKLLLPKNKRRVA